MINVGFIGLGGMGQFQIRMFTQVSSCRITAGSDVSPRARASFAQDHPDAAVYENHRKLLTDGRVDAVVIAVPTFLHKPIAIDVMKSGRPVLSEKPMARTVADGWRMIDAAEKTGQLLMVAHCRRFDTDWGTFAKTFRAGKLGSTVLWRHTEAGLGPGPAWFGDDKLGGGPLMDGAVHDHDFGNFVFGDPESAVASSIKLTGKTGQDTVTAVVRYRSGNQMMHCWSWGPASSGNDLHDVIGSEASYQFGPGPLADQAADMKKYGYHCLTNQRTRKQRLLRFPRRTMWLTQAKHFAACVAGKADCQSPGTEAIKAVAVAEAILKAAPNGGVRKVTW